MNFFKNLEQLSKNNPIGDENEVYFNFVLNSNNKECLKDLKEKFPSFEIKKSQSKIANHYKTVTMPISIARLFNEYISKIVEENNHSLSLESYTDEDLSKLKFKDYVDNYLSCFIYYMLTTDETSYDDGDDGDYHRHTKEVSLTHLFGEQILNSNFSHKNYGEKLIARVSDGLKSVYHTDFIIKKNKTLTIPNVFIPNTDDGLDLLITDIASIMKTITSNEVKTGIIYGLPSDMLSNYIKESRFEDLNFLIIIGDIITQYIQNNYSISKDFFVSRNQEIEKEPATYFATEYQVLDMLSHNRSNLIRGISDMIITERDDDVNELIKEFVFEVVFFFWGAFLVNSTFKHIKEAYDIALKENKSLLELSNGGKHYINKPSTTKSIIDDTLAFTAIDKKTLSKQTIDFLSFEIINSEDLSDEDLDDVPLTKIDLEDID